VAPANPGGGWDAMARTINRVLELEKLYPQPVSVLNKPGGGGDMGIELVAKAKPEVVAQAREKLQQLQEQLRAIEQHLSELES